MYALPLRGGDDLGDDAGPNTTAADRDPRAARRPITRSGMGRPAPRLAVAGRRLDVAPGRDATNSATDTRLVERIRAGDEKAFDNLVLTYYAPLCGFVAGFVASTAVAEEVTQDLFLTIWRKRGAWHVHSNLRSYLFGAARNMALMQCRNTRLMHYWEEPAEEHEDAVAMGSSVDAADQRAERADLSSALARAIAQLPARCRQVAVLRFEYELSYAEVAEVMGITVKAVERQATRALKALRREMAAYLEP
jgi:RNA polymerase sigma-70 factor (ECF subfamily)